MPTKPIWGMLTAQECLLGSYGPGSALETQSRGNSSGPALQPRLPRAPCTVAQAARDAAQTLWTLFFPKGFLGVPSFAQRPARHVPGEAREPGGRPGGGDALRVPAAPRVGG